MRSISKQILLLFVVGTASAIGQLISYDLEREVYQSHHEHFEQRLSQTQNVQQAQPSQQGNLIPIELTFTQAPYIYTGMFSFGSNLQQAKMRFTTNTDWTMVTGVDCYRCTTKAYDRTKSTTAVNGSIAMNESSVGSLVYAGETVKDSVCIGATNSKCVPNFEFFVINNDTEQRTELQRTDGIMGLAPDSDDNGPSYLTSLRALGLISKHQVSFRMHSMNSGKSKIVFGGFDEANMLPFPTKEAPEWYWYDNLYDDKEWGTELRNMYIGDVSLDSGNKVIYAKVDTLVPYIQLPENHFQAYLAYMKANHTEMECIDNFLGLGICKVTGKTCEQIQANYTNVTLRFNDSIGFVIPPTSYLKNDKTAQGTPMCYNMIIGNFLQGEIVVLGDIFLENYHVMYNFEDTTIALNGFVLKDLPIEPSKKSGSMTVIAIIIAVAVVMVASAIAIVCVIRKRNAKLERNLSSYNKLEEAASGVSSDIYQKPQIVVK